MYLPPRVPKLLRIMKITAILLLTACLHAGATAYSQKVTLSRHDEPLEEVFKEITQQTGYDFLYGSKMLAIAKRVTIDVRNATIEETLAKCFAGQPFSYEIVDKTVVIKLKDDVLKKNEPDVTPPGDFHGRVTGENGEPLVGVTVEVKGTKNAAVTDADGNFTLHDIDANATLTLSYVGYETQVFTLKGKTALSIKMSVSAKSMKDVTVNKGYYTEKQQVSVGNVSTVNGEDLRKQPVQDPILALEGRVPGLSIAQTSGVPGSYSLIQLRGQNFFYHGVSSNDPLYVIDGVPFSSESLSSPFYATGILGRPQDIAQGFAGSQGRSGLSPFSTINISDIESIDVLKDADATAMYGARGANGVILITTRKGKSGAMKVDLNYSVGTSRIARKFDLLNTQQYLEMRREATRNDGLPVDPMDYYSIDISGNWWDTTRYTDWQKEMVDKPASFMNAQASVSGGSGNTQYLVGGGWSKQGTTFPGDYSNQLYSLFTNINSASNNQRFRISLSASYGYNNNNIPGSSDLAGFLTLAPDAPALHDAKGNLNWAPANGFPVTWQNPLQFTYVHARSVTDNLVSNLVLTYSVLKGLDISTSLGYNKAKMNTQTTTPSTFYTPPDNVPMNDRLWLTEGETNSWIVEPKVSYHTSISKGKLDALVGGTFQETSGEQFANGYYNFSSDALITNPSAAIIKSFAGYSLGSYRFNSIYARLGYNWDEKYLLNLVARRDGSSRFGPSEQFGNFGSAGVGWVFSKEGFVSRTLPWLSFGKLRASYGTVGSDAIGDYQFMRTYGFNASPSYQNLPTLTPNGHANPYFQWQSVKKLELGLELGLIQDRINTSASYYRNRTGNQLVGYPLPELTGFGTVTENLQALIENTGWEFVLNTTNVKTRNFRWETTFNISFPNSKLVSFPGIENTSYRIQYKVGNSLSSQLLYHYLGVDPQTGVYTFAAKDGSGVPNGSNDQYWSKPIAQKYFGGFLNSFKYKGFSLDIFFQFVKQNTLTSPTILGPNGQAGAFNGNQPTIALKRWQKPGDKANIERFTTGNDSRVNQAAYNFINSDGAIVDASFIRLKNVSLSYTLPESWQKKTHLQGARLYIQCQNLLTFTHYPGWDPENGNRIGLSVPPYRTLTGGIQITL